MGALALDVAAVGLVGLLLYARPAVVLGVLVGVVLLVPGPLVVPHLHASSLTVDHVAVLAAAARVALMRWRGELAPASLQATPLHLALGLLLATWGVVRVLVPPSTAYPVVQQRLVDLLVVVVLYLVGLALLRHLDRPRLLPQLLGSALVVLVAIACVEHTTGSAFGQQVFRLNGSHSLTTAAGPLEVRGGHHRVRASAEFALALGWVVVMLVPALAVIAAGLRRRRSHLLTCVALVPVGLAVYWTYARSAAVALPVVLVLLALTARNRRLAGLGAVVVVAAVVLAVSDPAVRHHVSVAADAGSVGIRFQRLPTILDAVAGHPWLGLGFGGLQPFGFATTDNFYLAAYAETGVLGATVLVAAMAVGLLQCGRGLLTLEPVNRLVAAAGLAAFLAFLVSGAFYDALLLTQPAQLAVLAVAMATVAAERELGPQPLPRWSLPTAATLATAGALVGFVVLAFAPVRASQERPFSTVDPIREAAYFDPEYTATDLIGTVCELASTVAATDPRVHATCRDDFAGAGDGTLRISAPTQQDVLTAYDQLSGLAHRAVYLSAYRTGVTVAPVRARLTGYATAPATGALAGLLVALLVPLPRRRALS